MTRKKLFACCNGQQSILIPRDERVLLVKIEDYYCASKNDKLIACIEFIYKEKQCHVALLVQTTAHKKYGAYRSDRDDLIFQLLEYTPNKYLHDCYISGPRCC